MDTSQILGYLGALIAGLVLGLIGAGGSILTVPVLVYIVGVNPVLATAYSLFVVGVTSFVGAIKNIKKKLVDVKTAIVFAVPAFITVYITRLFLVPAIPENIFTISNFVVTKDIFIMVFFALIMLLAAFSMMRNKKTIDNNELEIKYNYTLIVIEGIIVGVLTGIVGAGGGFLIIPVLVLLVKLPMKKAVGTSLLIIASKSLIGFLGDVQNSTIDWLFILSFTVVSIIGMFIGMYLSKFISNEKLKKAFGWFLIVMAIYIIYKELG